MNNSKNRYYTSVNDIDDALFKQLGCNDTFYFSKDFLYAFEKAHPDIICHYVLIKKGQQPCALAIIQEIDVPLDTATEQLTLPSRIARSAQCYLNNRKAHILTCGNVFLSGNYGIYSTEGTDKKEVYETIAKTLKQLKTARKASVFFFKDFCDEESEYVESVTKHQFSSFSVEPNMRLKLHWDSFDNYKKDLKSKYRVKINKADKKSNAITVKSMSVQDIKNHLSEMQQLYQNITDRAGFNAVDISVEIYMFLKERFRESVYIHGYYIHDKLIGFTTAFFAGNTLDAHFIGLDYNQNKSLAIYPRMLNDYVRLGIDLRAKEINFGRTASEIKSTLGAIPEDLTCYVRHRRTLASMIFKPLVRQIRMTAYKQHHPFKSKK